MCWWFLLVLLTISQAQGRLLMSPSGMYNQLMMMKNSRFTEGDSLPRDVVDFLTDFRLDKLPPLSSSESPRESTQCQKDMQTIKNNLLTSAWARTYLDSWGTRPSGMMSLNLRWLGDFDPCIAIEPVKNGPNSTFSPQFCLAGFGSGSAGGAITTPKPTLYQLYPTWFFGMCIPNTCTPAEIVELLGEKVPKTVTFSPDYTHCVDTNPPLDTYALVAITCYSTVALFVALGLIVDIYQRTLVIFVQQAKTDAQPITISGHFTKLLLCFSPLTNLEKIFKPPSPNQLPIDLSVINGIRTFSLFWVILGHVYSFVEGSYDNTLTFFGLVNRTSMQFVMSGVFAVDSFFFLSGFLAYWSIAKVYAKMKPSFIGFLKTLPYTYFHRYIRLTPGVAAIILLDVGLWRYLYNGPLYFQATDSYCVENWWTNFIYVNNFIKPMQSCVGWVWYLANDMQFFILAPFIVYGFVRNPIFGWVLSGLVILVQIVASIMLTVQRNLPLSSMPPQDEMAQMMSYLVYFDEYYVKPYTRVGPYIVGVIACHLLAQHHVWLKRRLLSKIWVQLIGWILCLATILALIYGLADYYQGKYVNPQWGTAIYNAIARIAWGVALSWIVICAATKCGGLIGDFLSWPVFAVSARLSYSAYLVHPLVVMFYTQTQRRPFHLTDINIIFIVVGSIFNSLICAVIFSLGFESPVIALLQHA